MNSFSSSPDQAFEIDANRPANCFTVRRFGPVAEGIELSFDQGPNQAHPWVPHVKVGEWRLQRDNFNGCAYKVRPDGMGLVLRATLKPCTSQFGKSPFYTLDMPTVEKVGFSLLKVDLRIPGAKGVVVKDRQLSVYAGSAGGALIEGDGYEAVVKLIEGEKLTIFFEDGAVRRFIREGKVVERPLSIEEQLKARIDQAWNLLDEQVRLEEGEREKAIDLTLRGMVDLVNLTSVYNRTSRGQELRLMLITDFFLKLAPEALALIHRKLVAALYAVDSALVQALYMNEAAEELPSGVADLDRVRRERAAREAARRSRQLERCQKPQSGKKEGGKQRKQKA